MKLQRRTDLAVETDAYLNGNMAGAEVESAMLCGARVTKISIKTEGAAQAIGKPVGKYITIEGIRLSQQYRDPPELIGLIAAELGGLIPKKGTVLVAGLGNREITSDALGPKCADMILATRHFNGELAEGSGLQMLRSVCALSAGVLAQTGIESYEMISSVCDRIKPCAVIVIDALAARSTSRLGQTVQISSSGIAPGSGVGNCRKRLDEAALGVPVVSIGVPTVVDAATLALELAGRTFTPEEEKRMDGLVCGERMMVTPRDIDDLIEKAARLLAMSINYALQNMTDLDTLVSLVS